VDLTSRHTSPLSTAHTHKPTAWVSELNAPKKVVVSPAVVPPQAKNLVRVANLIGVSNVPLEYAVRMALLSMLFLQPFCAVWSTQSYAYEDRFHTFGLLWTGMSLVVACCFLHLHYCVLRALRISIKEKTQAYSADGQIQNNVVCGHFWILLSDIDVPESKTLVGWLKPGLYVCTSLATLFSMQGFYWWYEGWFADNFDGHRAQLVCWLVFYFVG
jgi:hypothetical protein